MREILIFAGTTEGRKLSEYLASSGVRHTLCVATEYGEIVLKSSPLVKVHQGRMDREEMKRFISEGNYLAAVDATHPYAEQVTRNVKEAADAAAVPYLRLKRDDFFWGGRKDEDFSDGQKAGDVSFFDSNEACARALQNTEGNILLTTGSRELSGYCAFDKVKSRLYVRILPSMESLSLCRELGICGKQIIAMQGPFTTAMNEALIRQYEISCLVTKESGKTGGFMEKLEAAKRTGVKVFVIGRPKEEEGYCFPEICKELEKLCGQKIWHDNSFEITLAGAGMGSADNLTKEVRDAVEAADILLGAERMVAPFRAKLEKRPFYQGKQIIPYLKEMQENSLFLEERKAVVLFSGDSGFYSGCQELCRDLKREIDGGRLRASVRILPGISSVAALASRIGENYQGAAIYSMHGRKLPGLIRKIKRNSRVFLLMSGVGDVNRLGELLLWADMAECEVTVGYQLSYETESVRKLSPKECCSLRKEGLYTCMVRNPYPCREYLTHGLPDGSFLREKVPMTKEEVREISICKLRLYRGAVVYDIGSGTGSVSMEIAGLCDETQVYAIERSREAVSLIERNKEKFGLDNITVSLASAPEGLDGLPMATHAFIGGSGGKLKEILAELYRINPLMRIVLSAISMETICEIRECMSFFKIKNEEIIQVQVSRARKAGSYHLMQAENPIWICAFDFYEQF